MTARDAAMTGRPAHDRLPLDAYMTPPWCVEALLSVWRPWHRCVEPACGTGNIVRVLQAAGHDVEWSDIQDYGFPETRTVDFLEWRPVRSGMITIITNPPYSIADQFVRRAVDLTRQIGGQCVLLLRSEWDSAARRRDLLGDNEMFDGVVKLTRRPRWIDGTDGAPRHNFSWFLWSWPRDGRNLPTVRYAP